MIDPEKKRVLFCNSLLSFLGEEIKSFNHKHCVCDKAAHMIAQFIFFSTLRRSCVCVCQSR